MSKFEKPAREIMDAVADEEGMTFITAHVPSEDTSKRNTCVCAHGNVDRLAKLIVHGAQTVNGLFEALRQEIIMIQLQQMVGSGYES